MKMLREYIKAMILEKELRGQKNKRTLYHIGKRPASPKPAERWGAKGEEGWSRDWIEGPVKSGVFLTPNPTDIAWNHGVSGNVYAYKVPHWVIEKSGGVNRFDTGSEVLISQEVWEEAGDEIEFLGKTMDKDELWDKVDSSDYGAKQKKGVRVAHKHGDGASSISGLRSTNHPEAAIKMMSQEEIKKALAKFEDEYAQEGPAEVVKGPRDRKGLVVPYLGKQPRGKDRELINLLKKHMNESILRGYVRSLLYEAVITGRRLDRYATVIKRHVINAIKDPEVRAHFGETGDAEFYLQDVPEVADLDYLRNVIIHMSEGDAVAADAAYEFDLDATPDQRKTSDLRVNLTLPRDFPDQVLNRVSDELIDAIRHELEHSGQETWELMDCQKKTPSADVIWQSLKNAAEYYLCPAEVKAHVAGFMKRAKTNREPLGNVIDYELYRIFETGKSNGYSERDLHDFMKSVKKQYYEYALERYPRAEGIT